MEDRENAIACLVCEIREETEIGEDHEQIQGKGSFSWQVDYSQVGEMHAYLVNIAEDYIYEHLTKQMKEYWIGKKFLGYWQI